MALFIRFLILQLTGLEPWILRLWIKHANHCSIKFWWFGNEIGTQELNQLIISWGPYYKVVICLSVCMSDKSSWRNFLKFWWKSSVQARKRSYISLKIPSWGGLALQGKICFQVKLGIQASFGYFTYTVSMC